MNVVQFPDSISRMLRRLDLSESDLNALGRYGDERGARVKALMDFEIGALRRFWDGIGDNSFYHGPEGSFDCADIYSALTLKGDGEYCDV